MNLRVDPTVHRDPMYPNLVRLLFEGAKAPEGGSESDFYMYVWLHDSGSLRGFQAVLDEKITFAFHVPSRRSFGLLARDIINRGITARESPQERQRILDVMRRMTSSRFPGLINDIQRLAGGEERTDVALSPEEREAFRALDEAHNRE